MRAVWLPKGASMNYVKRVLYDNVITQAEFARQLGISRSHLGHFLNDGRKNTIITIKFLAYGLAKIDGQPWYIHAKNIRDEVHKRKFDLRVINGGKR